MIKKIFKLLVLSLVTFSILSCATSNVTSNKPINQNAANIKKYNNSMFWEITGKDKNNAVSTVYILGTIHVGDDRLYPVPKIIEDAYNNSDKIIGELSTDAWSAMPIAENKLKKDSANRETTRIASTGKKLTDYLTKDENDFLLSHIENKKIINKYEPWYLSSIVSEIPVEMSGLNYEKSYDNYFIEKSIKNNKYIEGLDSIETHLSDISYGDWNTQLEILKDTIDDIIADTTSAGKNIVNIYEAYLSADEKKLSKIINSNMKNNDALYSAEYYNTLFIKKNKDWAEKIESLIKTGGKTFIFASCGHFVGDDSVFKFMADNGYLNY